MGVTVPKWTKKYLELLLMNVGEAELDDVIGQCLHLAGDPETVTVDLLFLL